MVSAYPLLRLLLLAPVFLVGCVHPNVPSFRVESGGIPTHHADADYHVQPTKLQQGAPVVGVLPVDGLGSPRMPGEPQPSLCHESLGMMDDPCACEEGGECTLHGIRGREPNVPWPRFHPLPVRPVYGATIEPSHMSSSY